ncbi:MAG: hypothetical protein ACEPOW_11100, partial [Bacteroidales bacterium]
FSDKEIELMVVRGIGIKLEIDELWTYVGKKGSNKNDIQVTINTKHLSTFLDLFYTISEKCRVEYLILVCTTYYLIISKKRALFF